jgi:hypothetical protein
VGPEFIGPADLDVNRALIDESLVAVWRDLPKAAELTPYSSFEYQSTCSKSMFHRLKASLSGDRAI